MTPLLKLHSIAFGLSTALVFSLWTQVAQLSEQHELLKILVGGLISLGIYRVIAKFIISLTKNSSFIKRQLLGTYYLGGTWVGFYVGADGKEKFLIERFEQDIDTLVIRGKSFNEKSEFHVTWTATPVNIDPVLGKISYMYECQPNNGEGNPSIGVAIFNFERPNQYSAAKELRGFSADLHLGIRTKSLEIKISNSCDIEENKALAEAKKVFNERKGTF